MTAREARNVFSPAKKLFIFAFILLLFVFILLPVFQQGKNYEYRTRISEKEINLAKLESNIRELRSTLAKEKTPETLLDEAYIKDDYEVVTLASVVRVQRGNV